MSYNIEEQEDYLKNHMPYEMEEAQWEAMQQRLKSKVLQEQVVPLVPVKKKPVFKIAIGAAASLLLLLSVYTFTQHNPGKEVDMGIARGENPEQYLDKTIGSLNEQELNWIHQLNENEIQEPVEYTEN